MLTAATVLAKGSWTVAPADTITLDYDGRRRRRHAFTADGGLGFLLDLPRPTTLRHGDGLALSDGRVVEVRAAAEELAEIHAASAAALARCAWHLGNRHLPVQVMESALRVRRDPVVEDLLRRLGVVTREIEAPFEPEGGAYSAHGHDS